MSTLFSRFAHIEREETIADTRYLLRWFLSLTRRHGALLCIYVYSVYSLYALVSLFLIELVSLWLWSMGLGRQSVTSWKMPHSSIIPAHQWCLVLLIMSGRGKDSLIHFICVCVCFSTSFYKYNIIAAITADEEDDGILYIPNQISSCHTPKRFGFGCTSCTSRKNESVLCVRHLYRWAQSITRKWHNLSIDCIATIIIHVWLL